MKKTILLLLLLLVSVAMPARAGSVMVIAHRDIPFSTLTGDELQRIFLGKKTFSTGDRRIVPVCLKHGDIHETFLRSFIDMNVSQFDIFWRQAVFIGTGTPPKAFDHEDDVIRFVENTPGGLGYIGSEIDHDTVKVITVKD
ncbi:ABC transporter substrate-binding protein [Desulfatiferula olefinivorans]